MCSLSALYGRENEVVEGLATSWDKQSLYQLIRLHLQTFFALNFTGIHAEQLLLDEASSVVWQVVLKVFSLLALFEPHGSTFECLLADEAISISDLVDDVSLSFGWHGRLEQDEVRHHLAPADEASRLGVQIADKGHEALKVHCLPSLW